MCYFLGAFGVVDAKYFKRNIHQEKKNSESIFYFFDLIVTY